MLTSALGIYHWAIDSHDGTRTPLLIDRVALPGAGCTTKRSTNRSTNVRDRDRKSHLHCPEVDQI